MTVQPTGGPSSNPHSREEERFFFEMSLDLLCVANFEGYFIKLNSAWERALGYSIEELMAVPYVSLVHPDDREATDTESSKLGVGVKTLLFENRYRRKDGSYIWLLWHAKPDLEREVIYATARDITHQKQMELELLKKSQMQQALLNGTDFTIISTDVRGIIQTFNSAAEKSLGYSAEEVIGHYSPIIFHDVDEVAQHAEKLSIQLRRPISPGLEAFATKAALGLPEEAEWTYIRKDGTRFPGQASVTALRDAKGNLNGFMSVSRNISERKRSENKFRSLLEAAPDAIVITNELGAIVLINAQAEKLFGYERTELLGKTVEMLLPERYRKGHPFDRKKYYSETSTRRPMGMGTELYALRKNGTEFPVEISLSPLETEEGVLISCDIRDITRRKHAENELKGSQERLRLALEAAQIGDWELNLATQSVRRSLRHDQIFGYSELLPEWTYSMFLDHVHPDDRARVDQEFQKSVAEGCDWYFECRIIRPDHSQRWIWARGSIFKDSLGNPANMLGMVGDITEQKIVDRALHDSEERVRLATEAAGIAVWDWDIKSGAVKWDEGMFTMYGLPVTPDGHTTYEEWRARLSPADLEEQEARLQHTVEICGRDQREFRIIRASDNAIRVIQSAEMVIAGNDGDAVRAVGINIDITDRKNLQQRLLETSSLQQAILNSANFSIISGSTDGLIQTFNAAAERELGYKAEEVIGKLTPASLHDAKEMVLRAEELSKELGFKVNPGLESYVAKARLGQVDEKEWTYIRKDGSTYPVQLSVTALYDESGCLTGFLGVGSNLSEKKRADIARREAEARLQGILDNTTSVIFIKNLEGRYQLINKRWTELFHMSDEDILGKADNEVFPPELANAFRENDLKVQAAGGPLIMEEIAPHDDGPHTYLSVKFPLRNLAGEVHAIGGIATDITDRKLAEIELQRSNADLEQFAYVASHDLQEPLRMVTSYLQLLERRYKSVLDEDAFSFIATAVDGTQRMRNLIQGLLSYSRVGTRGNPATPTDCQQILKTALTDLAVAIEESQAVITSDNLPIIQADELQIRQLFQNLVANAIKFRGTNPPQIHVGVSREDSMWKFYVRDNGIGIKPEFFDRIFVIFQRLHTREEYAGTGIGLALCKRIVERHEGRIWVESTEGKGTTFFFTLPVIREETRPLQTRRKRSQH